MIPAAEAPWLIGVISAAAVAGIIVRPFAWPEAIWPMAGAIALVALGALPVHAAWAGIASGADVYLFLIGMMLLAELAREVGLFDWLAAHAARHAQGSGARLFTLIYAVGVIVTVLLSNDATAVVLTPAVAAAARAARARDAMPYLLSCAFVANAASFVLPISNPANLVVYAGHMPPLLAWLKLFALPSLLSAGATYLLLRAVQRRVLRGPVARDVKLPQLGAGGGAAALGIAATAAALLAASAAGIALGWPTFLAGLATAVLVIWRRRGGMAAVLGGISWGVLPLVAGLFMLVEAIDRVGAVRPLGDILHRMAQYDATGTAFAAGSITALVSNIINNLPAGLIAGQLAGSAHVPPPIVASLLIGTDLGPNLSVTGSLATILWLTALRREGHSISAWRFLKIGAMVMPPALLLALLPIIFVS